MKSICEFCKYEFVQKRKRDPKRFCSRSCSARARPKESNKGSLVVGHTPWNKGLIGYMKGRKNSLETILKMRQPRNGKLDYKTTPDYRIRKRRGYTEWRRSVIERDKNCADCGSSKNLHAHHIIPIKEDISKAMNISNGITLCNSCHAKNHDFGNFQKKFTGKKAVREDGILWDDIEAKDNAKNNIGA